MLLRNFIIAFFVLGLAACASAQYGSNGSAGDDQAAATSMAPPAGFVKVSSVTPLPEFIPGLGTLYIDPDTLPAGPFLAYDRDGTFVSTIYMIPLADIDAHKKFADLTAFGAKTVAVSMYYNAGHPGVAEPHYHVVLWHVAPDQADLK